MVDGKLKAGQPPADNVFQNVNDTVRVIPVIEEHMHVGVKKVETGRLRVAKKVLTELYDANISVLKEDVVVEKKPINRYIDGEAPGIRLDGDTTIIPIVKEVIVKRLLLVEEVHITKRRTENTVPVHELLRKEEVTVTRTQRPADETQS